MTKPKARSHKNKAATRTSELPLGGGPGVEPLVISDIDRAVDAYETKKNKRCEASPGELAAKSELKELLIKHREELHTNEDGQRFYRKDGVDYILTEVLKRHTADDGDVREESI